jgi:dUTP pyrophosphatase
MRFYLAAAYERAEEMRGVRDTLGSMGHSVTSRWIGYHGQALVRSVSLERVLDTAAATLYADADLADLVAADVVVVCTSGTPTTSGGHHTEAGAALGLAKQLVVVGPRTNVFHCLPQVTWFPDPTAFLDALHLGQVPWVEPRPIRRMLPFQTDDPELMPTRVYGNDAGFDLYVSTDTRIPSDGFADVPMGVRVDLPDGLWALLTGRSSTIRRRGLLVTNGVIDTGWRGELFAGVRNVGPTMVEVKRGERIAQLLLMPNVAQEYDPIRVAQVRPSDRGESGFGSSGE